MANTTPEIEALAAEIGEVIYIDVAKWHLYLILDNEVSEDAVIKVLDSISVSLGGGKLETTLTQLLPTKCQVSLIDLLEEFQKNR